MLLDPTGLSPGDTLRADVCVLGGGAAGITITRALAAAGVDVLLLEGGELKATQRSQSLYEGRMETCHRSRKEDGDYLTHTRLRFFGGSTNHWMGWCLPFDPIDLEHRPWIARSGWPIDHAELSRWYAPARALVEIPPFEEDHGASRTGSRPALLREASRVRTRIFHYSPPTRFGTKYRFELVDASTVRVLLGANVLRLRADLGPEARVASAEVKLEDIGDITVTARRWVLACGGIENARLLLLSDGENPAGLGNEHDLVGRFFADHPHAGRVGEAVFTGLRSEKVAALYLSRKRDKHVGRIRTRGVFVLDAETQRREKLLGCSIQLSAKDGSGKKMTAAVATMAGRLGRGAGLEFETVVRAGLSVRSEQAPNPDSRVTLMDERDRLGLRRAKLDWRISDQDAHSIQRTLEILAHDLGASLLGRARLRFDVDDPWSRTKGGAHHLGTTRMAASPTDGVVDADCKVHGLDNLWIAGSSVFPTTGHANPTLTIVALALRLADRLERG
jgi:choline dehydrogenase-like flavoprotein